MATIAHYRQVLKRDFFPQLKILSGFLSAPDIIQAVQQAGHVWRHRI